MTRTIILLLCTIPIVSCYKNGSDLSGTWLTNDKGKIILTKTGGNSYHMENEGLLNTGFVNYCGESVTLNESGYLNCVYDGSVLNVLHYDKSNDTLTSTKLSIPDSVFIFRRK